MKLLLSEWYLIGVSLLEWVLLKVTHTTIIILRLMWRCQVVNDHLSSAKTPLLMWNPLNVMETLGWIGNFPQNWPWIHFFKLHLMDKNNAISSSLLPFLDWKLMYLLTLFLKYPSQRVHSKGKFLETHYPSNWQKVRDFCCTKAYNEATAFNV